MEPPKSTRSGISPCPSRARQSPLVITLSLIGGLRSFDLIWAMTGGGPGFASDVIASVIYKQYQAGFYGLSTAGSAGAVPARDRHRRAPDLVAQPWGGFIMKNTRGIVIGLIAIIGSVIFFSNTVEQETATGVLLVGDHL